MPSDISQLKHEASNLIELLLILVLVQRLCRLDDQFDHTQEGFSQYLARALMVLKAARIRVKPWIEVVVLLSPRRTFHLLQALSNFIADLDGLRYLHHPVKYRRRQRLGEGVWAILMNQTDLDFKRNVSPGS